MTKIKQAIEALERARNYAYNGEMPADLVRQALAILRSLPGPARDKEIHKALLKESPHILDQDLYYAGFRAAERRIFGE